jgi:putative membrane protein
MFTTAVYDDEMAEIMMGKLAKSKSTYISIKDFAGMIASDCIKVNQELAGIARKKNITLPAQPDSVMLKKIANLKQQEDIAFDQAYVNAMIDSHKKKLSLMTKESRHGADPDLRAFAGKITPTIKKHLQAIEKVWDQIK